MLSAMSDERRHLNSLGFAIGGRQSRALIAWGCDASGARISIEDAERGGSQGLRCECRAQLVAKKGEIREHHFAHKAGDVRHCEAAASAAVANFISDTLLDARQVSLPVTGGVQSSAQVFAVTTERVQGHLIQIVDAQRGRRLAIFVRVRRQNVDVLADWCRANDISGMVIDLSAFRNRVDKEIRCAIQVIAPRKWLLRSTRHDHQASPQLLRRLYGLRY